MREIDQELINQAQRGSRQAFGQLLRHYQPFIWNVSYSLTGNYHDSSELSQETVLRMYRHIKGFKGKSALSSWVYRIIRNCFYDLNNSKSEQNSIFESQKTEVSKDLRRNTDYVMRPNEIKDIFSKLPIEQREALILVTLCGYTYDEVATVQNVPVGTVRSRIFNARATLLKAIND